MAGLIVAFITLLVLLLYQTYGLWQPLLGSGVVRSAVETLLSKLSFVLSRDIVVKLWCAIIVVFSLMVKVGRRTKLSWAVVGVVCALGIALLLYPSRNDYGYLISSLAGFFCWAAGVSLVSRKRVSAIKAENDLDESFLQCETLIENQYSVNIPTRYMHNKKTRHGWVNVVAPFRGVIVLGLPGSGKSYSVYGEFIRQMARKHFSFFVYDYKYPDLSRDVYNVYLQNKDGYEHEPQFCVINFDDPRYSLRCNPMHPKYINDPADSTEIAELVMLNINKGSDKGKSDFFELSAKVYLDSIIWFLRLYQDGKYCTFPHAIELMSRSYERVFRMMEKEPRLKAKMASFRDALKAEAQDQLQGQIASARIPLSRFVSPQLYYILSGDDFDLKINDPLHPKILCVGNNPDRDTIYGTTLALFTSRMFKLINHPGGLPCTVMLDEFPTVYLKGVDKMIATARSNKVSVVLGAQDKGQIERDYSRSEAKVIFDTCATIFSGAVQGETAQEFNRMFGKEKRQAKSETQGKDSDSVSTSLHDEDRLPIQKITNLSVGDFFGKVGDDISSRIERKDFCATLVIDNKKRAEEKRHFEKIPPMKAREFQEDKVIARNRADGGIAAVKRYLKMEATRELDAQVAELLITRGQGFYPDNVTVAEEEVLERMAAEVVGERREKIIEEITELDLKNNAQRIVERNYEKICKEIDELLKDNDPEGEERIEDDEDIVREICEETERQKRLRG